MNQNYRMKSKNNVKFPNPKTFEYVAPAVPKTTKTGNDNYDIASQFADIIFTFKSFPQKTVLANRGILAIRSEYFRLLMVKHIEFDTIKYNDKHQMIIDVDFDPTIFKIIIKVLLYNDYMYLWKTADHKINIKHMDEITLFNIITMLKELLLDDYITIFANAFVSMSKNIKLLIELDIYLPDTYENHFINIRNILSKKNYFEDDFSEFTKFHVDFLIDKIGIDLTLKALNTLVFVLNLEIVDKFTISDIRKYWDVLTKYYKFDKLFDIVIGKMDPKLKKINNDYIIVYPIYGIDPGRDGLINTLLIPVKKDMCIYSFNPIDNSINKCRISNMSIYGVGILSVENTFKKNIYITLDSDDTSDKSSIDDDKSYPGDHPIDTNSIITSNSKTELMSNSNNFPKAPVLPGMPSNEELVFDNMPTLPSYTINMNEGISELHNIYKHQKYPSRNLYYIPKNIKIHDLNMLHE